MQSIVQARGSVRFPAFNKERHYMRPFTQAEGLPKDLRHWQTTVDQMLLGVDAPGPIYIMIDQSEVRAGAAQRRPGVHIDGYWNPGLSAHDSGGHVTKATGSHRPEPVHLSSPRAAWDTSPPRWNTAHLKGQWPAEAIILASDVQACRALVGAWDGVIGDGGDCSHLALAGLESITMQPNVAYAGNVTMLHESLPVAQDCRRTLVRLNVPGWTPH